MTSLATYGEISPSSLDLLTRFHPLNERSLLEKTSNKVKENETKENPTRGEADVTQMKGVGDAKTRVGCGRGRGRVIIQTQQSDSFIAEEIKNLKPRYSGFGSLSSYCGSTRNEASGGSEDSINSTTVNDLSLAMKGASFNENEKGTAVKVEVKKIKSRGRGRRMK